MPGSRLDLAQAEGRGFLVAPRLPRGRRLAKGGDLWKNDRNLIFGVTAMLDRDGYRPNVAIVIVNAETRSSGANGSENIRGNFRKAASIPVKRPSGRCTGSCTRKSGSSRSTSGSWDARGSWLRYEVPHHWVKREWRGSYRGQKQIWYLLRLVGSRHRRFAARERAPGIRRVALARLLGAARHRDRVQARGLPARAHRARALHATRSRRRGASASTASRIRSMPPSYADPSAARAIDGGPRRRPDGSAHRAEAHAPIMLPPTPSDISTPVSTSAEREAADDDRRSYTRRPFPAGTSSATGTPR